MILKDSHNATFLQALEAGLTHCDWLDGLKIGPCGRDHALASHSPWPEKEKALKIKDTFGPLFDGLSPSADLQLFLANKLREKMDLNGSPEYVLTWKQWDMPLGPLICALRASARRTSGKDCSGLAGWVSPTVQDHGRGVKPPRPQDTGIPLSQQVSGLSSELLNAPTENLEGYRLNPLFSLWLMGFPAEWACSKVLVTR